MDAVPVTIAGVPRRLPATWLRLHCPCEACQVIGIGERRVMLREQVDRQIADVCYTGEVLRVQWESGHESVYPSALLEELVAAGLRRQWRPRLWANDHSLARVDYDHLMGDRAQRRDALRRLRNEGVLVLRGVPTADGATVQFMRDLRLPIWEGPFGITIDTRNEAEAFNVSETAEALPLHTDLAGYQWPPSGQMLHMLRNDTTGGESVVVDGFRVLTDLRFEHPDMFEALAEVVVAHRLYSPDRETFARAPLVRCDANGELAGIRFSNQTLEPLPLDEPRLDEWLGAYAELTKRLHDARYSMEFRLEAGDAFLTHAHRVLHGRRAFGGTGDRLLRDVYFEFDNVLGLIDLLERPGRS